jgi:hypothetical protein
MAYQRDDERHERAAGGTEYDNPIRDRAQSLGSAIAENGPQVLFDELEKMLPDAWRENIATFPIAAVLLGFGIGVFLGLRKSDEVIAAGTSMITAAVMANVTDVMDRATGARD